MIAAALDTITVLRAPGMCLAKRMSKDGTIHGYDRARIFGVSTLPVNDLDGIGEVLGRLLPLADRCVIRGGLIDGETATGVRRLLHRDPETGDMPVFRDVPRRWLALDVEGIPLPETLQPADLAGCCSLALTRLPGAMQAAACIVQASGSHGFKPDMRLRLWFWLSRPTWGHELKNWFRGTPADPSVFGAVQPIYTAAPRLPAEMCDPLPCRLWFKPGQATVAVAPPQTPRPKPRPMTPRPRAYPMPTAGSARAELEMAAGRVCVAEKRHPTLVAEARNLARLVAAELLCEADLRATLTYAAKTAGKDDAGEIEACIDWGLSHPSTDPLPEMQA